MEVAALGLRVDGTQNIDSATKSLNAFTEAGGKAEKSTSGVATGSRKANKDVRDLARSAEQASGSMTDLAAIGSRVGGVLGAAFSINAIKNYADQWSDLQSRVGAATKDMGGAAKQMSRLVDIANASYSSLEQTVSAYAGNVGALQDLGKSAAEAADYTESLNHMLVLTATRGERAASVQNALSKAMAVGKLQAEGLETVLANGGEVASALAAQLGTTVSGLRAMASEGKITGDVIANAIINPLEEVRLRAAEMPATIGDAFTRIQTNTTELVGVFDKLTGASAKVSEGILSAADSMRNLSQNQEALENIAKAGEILAVVIGSRLVASTVAAAAAFTAKTAQTALATIALKAYEGQSLSAAAAQGVLASSARAASGAMALLGGPAGVIVTTLGLAALAWSSYGDSARDNADKGVLGLVDTKKEITDLIDGFEKLNKIQQQQTIDIKTQDMAEAAKDASRAFFDLGNAFAPAMDQGSRAAAQFRADFNADIKDVADNTNLSADQMANALVRVIDEYVNSGRATEAGRKKMLEYAQALATAKGEANGLRGELAALSNVQDVYTEGMGNSPAVQKQNEAMERAVQAALNATKSFRSVSERVQEVRDSSSQAAAALKELEASGKGSSDAANILRGRIEGANKEIEKLQKGSSSAAASKVKLKDASKELEAQIKREQAAYAQLVESQQEVADYQVQLSKNQEALGLAFDKTTRTLEDQAAMLDLEERMIGKSNAERQIAIEKLQIERDLREEIAAIDAMDLDGGEAARIEARARARKNAAKKTANAERKVYIDTWNGVHKYIEDGLYDAIVTGGASAKDALKRMFENMVLRPVVQAGVNALFGGQGGAGGGGSGSGMLDSLSSGQSLWSAFSGSLTAGVGGTIASLGATLGASAATAFGSGIAAGGSLGLTAGLSQGASMIGAGAGGTAAGLGTMAGAAMPWVAGAAALYSIIKSFDDSGTLHYGAGSTYSGGKLQEGAGIYNRSNFGMGAAGEWSADAQKNVSSIAGALGAALDSYAVSFGQKAGYEISTAFADDSSDDGAWGSLRIADAMGNALVDWENSRSSKWAPKEFASGDEGYQQYLNAVAVDVKSAFLAMDIPAWGKQLVDAATDLDSLSAALAQVGAVKTVLDSLGKSLSMFADLSGDAQTTLLNTSGGIDALAQNASSFYQGFYSEQERYENSLKQMQEVLAGLNVSIDPAMGDRAKADFRAAVSEAFDAGQFELGAQLLGINQQFAAVADYAQKAGGAIGEVADVLSDVMRDLLDDRKSLEADLLRAQGDESGYLSAVRAIATAGYAEAEIAAWDYNTALQAQIDALDAASAAALDAAAAESQRVAAVAQERAGLERQLLQQVGDTAAIRALERAALDESNRALYDHINALQDQRKTAEYAKQALDNAAQSSLASLAIAKDATSAAYAQLESSANREKEYWQNSVNSAQDAIGKITSIVGELKSNATDLYSSIDQIAQQQAIAGSLYIESVLDAVRGGASITGFEGLSEAATSASSGIQDGAYATEFERRRDALVLAGRLSELGELSDEQLSTQERMLKSAQEQIKQIDETLIYWRSSLDNDKLQIDATLSISGAVANLAMAVSKQAEAAAAAAAAEARAAGAAVKQDAFAGAIKGVQGTTVSQQGALYAEMAASGLTHAQIVNATIKALGDSPDDAGWGLIKEAAGLPSYAVGTPYVPEDQIALIHKGEAVVPAAHNPFSMSGNAAQMNEGLLRQLISDNRAQAGELIRLNARVARLLERWDGDGLPTTRDEAAIA
jgi:tape measure domain-containing protein